MRIPVFTLYAFVLASATAGADIRFKHHFIDNRGPDGTCWGSNVIADFDKDGRLDVAIGKSKHGQGKRAVYWYRNLGGIDRWSERLVMHDSTNMECGGAAVDVDGDGYPDFVGSQVLISPGAALPDGRFEKGSWETGDSVHDIEHADFDGDGIQELVVNLQHDSEPGLYLFRAPEDRTKPWQRTRVVKADFMKAGQRRLPPRGNVHAAVSPRGIGDLDGDGDADIAWLGSWVENTDGKGGAWKEHRNLDFRPNGPWGMGVRCWIADMDGDGNNDIVQSKCDGSKAELVWMRNVRGDGSEWEMIALPDKNQPGDFHSLAVADFDLDGDMDVYVDEMEHLNVPKSRQGKIGMIVWENADGKGREWRQQMIVTGLGGHQAQAADIDGDGDVDIVTRPYTPQENANGNRMHVSILENLAVTRIPSGPGSGLGPNSKADIQVAVAEPEPKVKPKPQTVELSKEMVAVWDKGENGSLGNLDLSGEAMSVSAWIMAEEFSADNKDGRVISKASGTEEQDHYWMLSAWEERKANRLRFRLKAGGKTTTLVARNGTIRAGEWMHVAAVYDGRAMTLYQNGVQTGRIAKTGRIDRNPGLPVWIGDNPPERGSKSWRGEIDKVRVYDRALNETEIRTLAKQR